MLQCTYNKKVEKKIYACSFKVQKKKNAGNIQTNTQITNLKIWEKKTINFEITIFTQKILSICYRDYQGPFLVLHLLSVEVASRGSLDSVLLAEFLAVAKCSLVVSI